MSAPTTKNFPVPKSILRVEGDPTAWELGELEIGMAQQLASPDPVALQVVKPLAGHTHARAPACGKLRLVTVAPGRRLGPLCEAASPSPLPAEHDRRGRSVAWIHTH